MPDLSVLIAARNEIWVARTIEDVLRNSRADTEIIVVLDGAWADPQIPDHPRVRVVFEPVSIGQRAAVNLAAKISTARYLMKLDAHCAVAEGFDETLIKSGEELGHVVTQIPTMYNLHCFDRICKACGHRMYQGPNEDPCEKCQQHAGFEKDIVWKPRLNRRSDFMRFDHELHFQYWSAFKRRPEAQGEICDLMSSVGACFFMRRKRFWELDGMDEQHGSWGAFGVEVACKSWLSGGRHVVCKKTWFAHMFRTQGKSFGFPYAISNAQQERAREHSRKLWLENTFRKQTRPLSWLIEKFSPVPDWSDPIGAEALALVMKAGDEFQRKRAA